MSLLQKLIGAGLRPYIKRRARGLTLEQVAVNLGTSRDELLPRIMRATDTPGNREALNHWVGIERWSQSRLRVALGAPLVENRYAGYRMPAASTLTELQAGFTRARGESIQLAREFARLGVDPTISVRHNDLGDLSVTEWFTYIEDHPRRESFRLKGR